MQDILSSVYCFRSEQTSVLGLITFGPNWKFHKSDYYYYSSIYVVAIFIISTFSLLINSWNGDFQHFQLWKKENFISLFQLFERERHLHIQTSSYQKNVHNTHMHTCASNENVYVCENQFCHTLSIWQTWFHLLNLLHTHYTYYTFIIRVNVLTAVAAAASKR